MLSTRHLIRNTSFVPRLATTIPRHSFHTTTAKMVKVGDPIPSVELVEGTPGNKVNLANELKGKGLIIGVPAAFSKYLAHQFAFLPAVRSVLVSHQLIAS